MNEFWFVVKCLGFACLLVLFSQLKVSGQTIESHCTRWLESSKTATYLQTSAQGGVLALQNFYASVKSGTFGGQIDANPRHLPEQKASR